MSSKDPDIHVTHHLYGKNVTTSMVGLKRPSHKQNSPTMVNPRDIAGNAEEEKKDPCFAQSKSRVSVATLRK